MNPAAGGQFSLSLEASQSQYVTVADAADLDPTNLTAEIYVRWGSLLGSSEIRQLLDRRVGGSGGYEFFVQEISGNTVLNFTVTTASGTYRINWAITPSVGPWSRYSISYDSTAQFQNTKLFFNGVDQGAGTVAFGTGTDVPGAIGDAAEDLHIGARAEIDRFWDGQVDDLRIWSTVRTAQQIDDNKAVELAGDEVGLVLYHKYNGDLLDATSNGHDGTAVNGAGFSSEKPF